MALEIVVTTNRWKNDPASREFVGYLKKHQATLKLEDAILYYDFPAYADYEATIFRPDILLFSPKHGFIAVRFFDDTLFKRSTDSASDIDNALDDFVSNLHSRLVRSRALRKTRTSTIVEIHPVIFNQAKSAKRIFEKQQTDANVCDSLPGFSSFLGDIENDELAENLINEIRSVVEGAKALTRTQKRIIKDPEAQPLAVQMAMLESEIANFDERQRKIALVEVGGPARIRGLAGSGKTVILAMKAAHLHLNNPDALILFTFFTKSLRATIKSLITKFFRLYSDTDPNWKMLHVRHSWGGANIPGVYSQACERSNQKPLTLREARAVARRGETAFSAICSNLLETGNIKPYYDHVLIDEGQDFPDSFYRLALKLTKGERDKQNIIWAYDELQDILDVKIRQPRELFGVDDKGAALVDLDRSSKHLPPGATNDAVLAKAYRNQRDVLVSSHALGFGIYGEIVQMLESAEHWEDVGYEVLSGPLVTGQKVEIMRPDSNSPLTIPNISDYPIIQHLTAKNFDEEVDWVTSCIKLFIEGGLSPEEIIVISLDDRNAKHYLAAIAEDLSLSNISSNNIIADPYNEPPFTISNKVTLSTVYRAKGNEASVVIAVGIDALETKSRDGRNRIFTAFTRTKAWLRVSGIGEGAKAIIAELDQALSNSPKMKFVMPDLAQIDTIQRGFSKKQAAARAARKRYIDSLRKAGLTDEEIEEELSMRPISERS